MRAKAAISRMAREWLLAGLSLALISGSTPARGADPAVIKKAALRGLDGQRVALAAPAGGATVLVFYSTECPISNAYSPTLGELMGAFRAQPLQWMGVCVDPDLSDSEVKTHAHD